VAADQHHDDAEVLNETLQRDTEQGGMARAQSTGGSLKLLDPHIERAQEGFVPQGY